MEAPAELSARMLRESGMSAASERQALRTHELAAKWEVAVMRRWMGSEGGEPGSAPPHALRPAKQV